MTDGSPRRRRRRTPMASRRGTIAEGQPLDSADDPEVADLDLNERVSARVPAAEAEDFTPINRLREVGDRASNYEREYRLKLLHRLLMRGIALDVIAQELRVSVATVLRDRKELYRLLKTQASTLDANELIGETLGFYGETQAMALKMASQEKTPPNMKLASIRTALSSRNDRHRFLQAAGVFDVLQFAADDSSSSNDLDRLMQLTEKLIESDDIADELADINNVDVVDSMVDSLEEEREQDIQLF